MKVTETPFLTGCTLKILTKVMSNLLMEQLKKTEKNKEKLTGDELLMFMT